MPIETDLILKICFFSKRDQLPTKIELDLKSLVLFDVIGTRNIVLPNKILFNSKTLPLTIWSNNNVNIYIQDCPFILDGALVPVYLNNSKPILAFQS